MSRPRRFRLKRLFFESLEDRSMLSASLPVGPTESPEIVESPLVSEQASAQFTDTQSGSTFHYSGVLQNTGSTPIETFWYSWIPGADFMGVSPTNISSPAGWTEIVTNAGSSDGFAIQWTTSTAPLAAGGQLSGFKFDSTSTPAQLNGNSTFHTGTPVGTSFVYQGAPESDPGFEFVASVATPTPDLAIAVSHTATFHQSDAGDTYTIVANNLGPGATSGLVTVTDTLPTGLTPTAASGSGWTTMISGSTVTATRSDALASGSSCPALTVTVSVASNAPASVGNTVTVSGGGETNTSNDSATDTTAIGAALPPLVITGATGDIVQVTFTDSNDFTVTVNSGSPASHSLSAVDKVVYNGPNSAFSEVIFSSLATNDAYTAIQSFTSTSIFRAGGGFELDANNVENVYAYVANASSTATVNVASGAGNFFVNAANDGFSYIGNPTTGFYSELSGFGSETVTGSGSSTYAYMYSTSHASAVGDPAGSTFTVGNSTTTLASFPQVYFVGATDGTDNITLHTQGGSFVGQPTFSYESGTFNSSSFLIGALFAASLNAQATNPTDSAFFYSYAGDTFNGSQASSSLTGSASSGSFSTFTTQASGFNSLTVLESGGGTDTANFTSPGSGTVNVTPTVSTLVVGSVTEITVDTYFSSNGSFVAVLSKLNLTGNANGTDTVNFNDATGANSLVGQGNKATFTTPVNTVIATQFGKVNAFQSNGSPDTVHQQAIDFALQTIGNWTTV